MPDQVSEQMYSALREAANAMALWVNMGHKVSKPYRQAMESVQSALRAADGLRAAERTMERK